MNGVRKNDFIKQGREVESVVEYATMCHHATLDLYLKLALINAVFNMMTKPKTRRQKRGQNKYNNRV